MKDQKRDPSLISERGVKTWNLVALGDSTPTGYGLDPDQSYVQVYANYIQEDLNVDVVVHNWATNETRTVSDWVKEVQKNEELRKDLSNAGVITIWLGWHNVIPHIIEVKEDSGIDIVAKIDSEYLQKVTFPMHEAFDKLLSEVSFLAPPNETLILIADVGIPSLLVRRWKEYGTFKQWNRLAYQVWREYIIQAANKHSIYVVHTHEIINSPDGNQAMPTEYMQSDGLHFNEEGHKIIAKAHRIIGYQYSSP